MSGCISNPDQGVYYIGNGGSGSNASPARPTTASTVIDPSIERDNSEFESCHTLDFYRGYSTADELRDICISRKINSPNIARIIKSPNLPSSDRICIVTGLQYDPDTVPQNEVIYVMDINEVVCGRADSDFQLHYSDYNVFTIVIERDLNQLEEYAHDDTDEYPSMAEGKIGEDENFNDYN